MNRIEEVIKEHGYTITSLAEKIGTSKQNLFAKLKSPSYPTLIEIATALNVPMWQLFASPEEIAGAGDFVAFIKDGREIYHADSWQELEKLVSNKK
ncbi:MAG: helix-turn-helix transcriptional regulator [Prevotella salivae]|nr:helix-turn-helix transcriptional regulator [Segatella salivae]